MPDRYSDSLMISATGESTDRLFAALKLNPFDKISGITTSGNSLVLHEYRKDKEFNLPVPTKVENLLGIVEAWLDAATYGPQPDIDGDCKKGWKLEGSNMSNSITITPHWMIYHK